MTRQQFLAEFNQYLTFFTPQEQTAIIKDITDRFDAAGEGGESAVVAELGTPMKLVISLKRRKEAGEDLSSSSAEKETNPESPADDYSVETDSLETIDSANTIDDPLLSDELNIFESDGDFVRRKSKASVPGVIFSTVFSVIFAALFLAIAAVGAGVVTAACSLLLAGLQSLSYVTDALYLFCGGLVCAAVGFLIIWFAVWAAITLISKLYRSAGVLKSSTVNGRNRMRSIWKVILLIFVFLLLAGIICGCVAYFMGGDMNALAQNGAAAPVLTALSPDNLLKTIYAFFGI